MNFDKRPCTVSGIFILEPEPIPGSVKTLTSPTSQTKTSKMMWALCFLFCFLPRLTLAFQAASWRLPPVPIRGDSSHTQRHHPIIANKIRNNRQVLQVSREGSDAKARGKRQNRNFKKNFSINNYSQFNRKITECQNAKELLLLLSSVKGALTSPAGGGKLNSL